MAEENEEQKPMHPDSIYFERTARELKQIRELLVKAVNYMVDAEREIPERVRRFVTYMHDVHDIIYMYEERGHQSPDWIREELMRCDDRFRQILDEMHKDGGAFEKVRREMAADPENKWDHTRQLSHRRT